MKFIPRPLVETADISRGRPTFKSLVKGAVSGALVLALLYLFLGFLAAFLAETIPDRWERRLSGIASAFESAESDGLERAQAILDRLTDGESLRDLDYALFTFPLDHPNAVAVPGGGIGVTPGLLASIESDAGLAFVLAHELGHHQHRHSLHAMGRQLLLGLAASFLFSYDGLSGVNAAFRLADTAYSRKQEEAADEFALRLVHRKYGSTEGALEFFDKIQAEDRERFWQKYAGSHPLTADRIAALRKVGAELRALSENPE